MLSMSLSNLKKNRQVIFIMRLLQTAGLIVNLAKSIVSSSNVFTEEYITHCDEDYSKQQLLILPIVGALFQPETWAAKRFTYTIGKMLIGSCLSYYVDTIIDVCIRLYPPEFGRMDHLLPYHYGGWKDFSETNFSCIVEYALDPTIFFSRPNDLGSVPEIRRWLTYILVSKGENTILSGPANIPYRGPQLSNPLKDREVYNYEDELSAYVWNYSGDLTQSEYEESYDTIINYRGLHNAKPKLKLGLIRKTAKKREAIYRKFKKVKQTLSFLYSKDLITLSRIMDAISTMNDKPSYLSFPRMFIEKSIPTDGLTATSLSITVVKKTIDAGDFTSTRRTKVVRTLESIRAEKWIYGSDPFIFYDLWRRSKSGHLISNIPIPNYSRVVVPALPPCFKRFCPNAELFKREIMTRTGSLPLSYHFCEMSTNKIQIATLKDAFGIILPVHLKGMWRSILYTHRKRVKDIREMLSSIHLDDADELERALYALKETLDEELELPDEEVAENELLYDSEYLLNKYDDVTLFNELISEEYTVEDALEYADYDYEDLEEENESPREEFIENILEEYIEDEEIEDLEDLDQNEIRRVNRPSRLSCCSLQ